MVVHDKMTCHDIFIFVVFTIVGTFLALSMTSYYNNTVSVRECLFAERFRTLDLRLDIDSMNNTGENFESYARCLKLNSTRIGLYKLWNKDNFKDVQCNEKTKKFITLDDTEIKTGLASIPGSGNTWVRHLMEQLTGIYTGSIYNSHVIMDTFKGENTTEHVIAVKTHEPYKKSKRRKFDRMILIIRDPFETTLSEYNRKATGSKTNLTTKENFNYRGFQKLLRQWISKWPNFYEGYLTSFPGPIFVIFYEKLESDLVDSLLKLSKFLKTDITLRDLWCIYRHSEGSYHRPAKPEWMSRSHFVYGDLDIQIDRGKRKIVSICNDEKNKGRILTNL